MDQAPKQAKWKRKSVPADDSNLDSDRDRCCSNFPVMQNLENLCSCCSLQVETGLTDSVTKAERNGVVSILVSCHNSRTGGNLNTQQSCDAQPVSTAGRDIHTQMVRDQSRSRGCAIFSDLRRYRSSAKHQKHPLPKVCV